MKADEPAHLEWTGLEHYVSVETASLGFVDGAVLSGIERGESIVADYRSLDFLMDGRRGVLVPTGGDGGYDLEVAHDTGGMLAAIRSEFVNDIAVLDGVEGAWADWEHIDIDSGQLLVCDPFCISAPTSRVFVEAPNGRHRVQICEWHGGEVLAVRVIFERN